MLRRDWNTTAAALSVTESLLPVFSVLMLQMLVGKKMLAKTLWHPLAEPLNLCTVDWKTFGWLTADVMTWTYGGKSSVIMNNTNEGFIPFGYCRKLVVPNLVDPGLFQDGSCVVRWSAQESSKDTDSIWRFYLLFPLKTTQMNLCEGKKCLLWKRPLDQVIALGDSVFPVVWC